CAIAMSDNLPSEMRVVIPQAANDLLAIQGVLASFVAVKVGESVSVSARSLGEINVQVIMEKLGGGGHLTMAGTQIDSTDMMEVKRRIIQAIDEYWQDNKKDENKG
ncbi:MAG: DHHA1 domain-containing protein, partial [Oscillospiraceae bacterium]